MLALIAFHILKRNTVNGINTLYKLLSGNVCVCCIDVFVWVCTRMNVVRAHLRAWSPEVNISYLPLGLSTCLCKTASHTEPGAH